MTNEEKKILKSLITKSISSLNKLKLTYGGSPTSFSTAMYAQQLRDSIDHDLHDFLEIKVEVILDRVNKKISHLKSIEEKLKL